MRCSFFLLAAFTLWLAGCAMGPQYDTSTPGGAYRLAEKYEKDERYEEALVQYAHVKNKHPYSRLATAAELKIADIHFKREDFVEAQNAYQVFKELHPSHPRSDYVTYRLGLSFFMQLPSTIDRDLSVAERAILYFDEVILSYPQSEYVKEAQAHKDKSYRMLAEKEHYIANFYFIRGHYQSALHRYEGLLAKYPGRGLDAKALYGATISAYRLKDLGKAKRFYETLVTRYKNTDEAKKARREVGDRI